MKTKEVKDIIDILTTEVKINEIDKTFLENVPKVPTHAETFRSKNIVITLALGGLLSALLITLMIFTINNPFFSKDKPNPVTETKKQKKNEGHTKVGETSRKKKKKKKKKKASLRRMHYV